MEYLLLLSSFAVVHFLAAASPGPNMVLVTSHSISNSRKAGCLLAVGIALGTITWSASIALGLGIVVEKLPLLYSIIQYAGAAYLLWLGWKMLHEAWLNKYRLAKHGEVAPASSGALVLKGYLVNMTNPKSIVYWTSLFSVLIPAGSPTWIFGAAIAIAATISFVWWLSVAIFFSNPFVQQCFLSVKRYLDGLMGAALIFLGLRLAFDKS